MSGYLTLTGGRVVPVQHDLTIGRAADCGLPIDDGKASRKHARLVVEGGVVEIEDLASSNGTLLNGKPVTRRVLRDGDEVQIGKTVLVFRDGAPPGAVPAGPARGGGLTDDDDDLFGGGGDVAAAPPASARPPAPAPVPAAVPPATSPRPAAPLPPAPPKPAVVEFEDEVVEVRAAPAPKVAAAGKPPAGPVVQSPQRILQFSPNQGRRGGGVLGDDLEQVGGGQKALLYAAVLAVALGLGWLTVWLVR